MKKCLKVPNNRYFRGPIIIKSSVDIFNIGPEKSPITSFIKIKLKKVFHYLWSNSLTHLEHFNG